MHKHKGWTFDVWRLVRGPVDSAYADKRRLATAEVRILAGIGQEFTISLCSNWLRGETDAEVRSRFLRLAALRVEALLDGLIEQAEFYERLAKEDPDAPSWGLSGAENDNCALAPNLPPEVWQEIDRGAHPLTAVRTWRGLSIGDLARDAGRRPAKIAKYEAGAVRPAWAALIRLARRLEVRPHLLMPEPA